MLAIRGIMRIHGDGRMCMVSRLLCLVLLLATPSAVAAQGPLLWDLTEDFAGGTDIARNLRLSGGVAVVVGNGGQPLDGTDEDDLVIQALRRPTGGVQWSDRAFLSLGNVQNVFVATSQHRAYAVGTLNQPGDPRNAILV